MTPQSKRLFQKLADLKYQVENVTPTELLYIFESLSIWVKEVDARLEHFDIREKARFNADPTTPKIYMGAPEFVGRVPPINHEHSNIEFHTEEMRRMLAARLMAGEFNFKGETGGKLCDLIRQTTADIAGGRLDHDPKLVEGLILYIAGACLELLEINHQRAFEKLTEFWTGKV